MVKVTRHNVASTLGTNHSILFARWCQGDHDLILPWAHMSVPVPPKMAHDKFSCLCTANQHANPQTATDRHTHTHTHTPV